MRSTTAETLHLLKRAADGYKRDRAEALAAALAYYSVFSLAPLVLFGAAVLSLRYGPEASRAQMLEALEFVAGPRASETARPIVADAGARHGMWATLFGLATLLFGASSLFVRLQEALNVIFEAKPKGKPWLHNFLRRRSLSVALVLLVPALLLAGPAVAALVGFFGRSQWASAGVTLGSQAVVFAFLYKFMTEADLSWGDVWPGAIFTASLFTLGQTLLGVYVNHVASRSVYGAAGALVAFLVWIHASAQILLFGAEVVQAYRKTPAD